MEAIVATSTSGHGVGDISPYLSPVTSSMDLAGRITEEGSVKKTQMFLLYLF